jgi:hypothetical protein
MAKAVVSLPSAKTVFSIIAKVPLGLVAIAGVTLLGLTIVAGVFFLAPRLIQGAAMGHDPN